MSTAPINSGLATTLFGKARRAILSLLYGHADEAFYLRQIVRATGTGLGPIQRELKAMTAAGIVTRERKGNLVYYRANEKCPIFNELKSLARKMVVQSSSISPYDSSSALPVKAPSLELAKFCRKHHIRRLSFFGSVLRDDFHPDSDVDVLVEFELGHVPGFGIIDIEDELSRLLGRKADLRTPGDISRYFRDRVIREARLQYAET